MAPLLAAFGFCWMCAAAVLGLVLGVRQDNWMERLEALAKDGLLLDYHREHSAFRSRVTVHAHAFLFSVVCLLVSVVMSRMALPQAVETGVAWTLMIATVVWSVGALARVRAIMGLGDFMFFAAILVTAFGLARQAF